MDSLPPDQVSCPKCGQPQTCDLCAKYELPCHTCQGIKAMDPVDPWNPYSAMVSYKTYQELTLATFNQVWGKTAKQKIAQSVPNDEEEDDMKLYRGRSQKVDGLRALAHNMNQNHSRVLTILGVVGEEWLTKPWPLPTTKIGYEYYLPAALKSYKENGYTSPYFIPSVFTPDGEIAAGISPIFARPCPVRPRHGFVDSRRISSQADLVRLVRDTLQVEPEGVVMLTPLIEAETSAIWTPTLFTAGLDHDGATAGRNTATLPLAGLIGSGILSSAKQGKVDLEREAPYIEMVIPRAKNETTYMATLTQLRAGPKMDSISPDYIPTTQSVVRIHEPKGMDLVEWESLVERMIEGDVIYHPGGSPADHYFVHARTHKIPVLTTYRPEFGSKLVPDRPSEEPSPQAVIEGFIAGSMTNLASSSARQSAAVFLLMAVHNSAAMIGEYGRWIGAAAAIQIRLGAAAASGERRHYKGSHEHRATVHNRIGRLEMDKVSDQLQEAYSIFKEGHWEGAFGGKKWAQCVMSIFSIEEAAIELATEPSERAVGRLIRAMNISVNQAHNGGTWFDKFMDHDFFDLIPAGDPGVMGIAAPIILEVEGVYQKLRPEDIVAGQKMMAQLEAQPTLPPLSDMKISIVPFTGVVLVQAKSKLIGDRYRPYKIPMDAVYGGAASLFKGDLVAVDDNGRLGLDSVTKGIHTRLWTEPALKLQEKG